MFSTRFHYASTILSDNRSQSPAQCFVTCLDSGVQAPINTGSVVFYTCTGLCCFSHDICWVIHLDPALYSRLYIQVTIKELDLRAPNNCSTYASDYLEFRDGTQLILHIFFQLYLILLESCHGILHIVVFQEYIGWWSR